jgi:hypothetical protein
MGLLNNDDWKAKWISLADEKAVDIPEINRKFIKFNIYAKILSLRNQLKKPVYTLLQKVYLKQASMAKK